MLQEGFRFAGLDAYYPPAEGDIEGCREIIQGFPMDEDPRVFGLHPNALITAQYNQALRFHDTILAVQPRIASAGGGKTSEEIVDEIANDFLQRIPDAPKAKLAHASTYQKTAQGGIVSTGVFHGQEYTRLSKMISTIKNTRGSPR